MLNLLLKLCTEWVSSKHMFSNTSYSWLTYLVYKICMLDSLKLNANPNINVMIIWQNIFSYFIRYLTTSSCTHGPNWMDLWLERMQKKTMRLTLKHDLCGRRHFKELSSLQAGWHFSWKGVSKNLLVINAILLNMWGIGCRRQTYNDIPSCIQRTDLNL